MKFANIEITGYPVYKGRNNKSYKTFLNHTAHGKINTRRPWKRWRENQPQIALGVLVWELKHAEWCHT